MRKLALSLLAGSLAFVPYAALSQEDAAPTADDFVCALAGDCAEEEATAEPGAAPAAPGSPRVSATRGFSLSRTTPAQPKASAGTTTRQRTAASRPAQRPATSAAQQQGRVDLRLAFDSGSAELDDGARERLKTFAEALKRPQLAGVRVRIEGHTDSSGGRALNLWLSQARAQAVADFLVSQGIEAGRLDVRGFGYDQPLPGRQASDGENRRVEAVRVS